MASNSTNNPKPSFTEDLIKQMQQYVLEHPIDPAYDEIANSFYDGLELDILEQINARADYSILKKLGRLPEGME